MRYYNTSGWTRYFWGRTSRQFFTGDISQSKPYAPPVPVYTQDWRDIYATIIVNMILLFLDVPCKIMKKIFMFWRKLQAGVMAWHPGLLSAPLLTPAPPTTPLLPPLVPTNPPSLVWSGLQQFKTVQQSPMRCNMVVAPYIFYNSNLTNMCKLLLKYPTTML